MAASQQDGNWEDREGNIINYELKTFVKSENQVVVTLHIHKKVSYYLGQDFKTRSVSFLGYNWIAWFNPISSERFGIWWLLDRRVDRNRSARCCWLMKKPDLIPCPFSHLLQDRRYGETNGLSWTLFPGDLLFEYHVRLYQPEEEVTVHQDNDGTYCLLWLKRQLHEALFWTNRFKSTYQEWGVYVHCSSGEDGEIGFHFKNTSGKASFPVNCQLLLIDQSSPELSCKLEDQRLAEYQSYYPGFMHLRKSRNLDVNAFTHDGWLKLVFRISQKVDTLNLAQEFLSAGRPHVKVEVLEDQHIKEHVTTEAPIDVLGIPTNFVYLCPPNKPLKDVKQMIERDAQLDTSRSTLWLLNAKRNGVFSKAVCLDALAELDFRLFELSVQTNANEDQKIAFFFSSTDRDLTATRPQDLFLLFCILMDPEERKVRYLGSIEEAANSGIPSLYVRFKRSYHSIFIMQSNRYIYPMPCYGGTVNQNGLTSGNVIIVRLNNTNQTADAAKVREELQDWRGKRPDVA